ncbi:MAG: lytic transglycosylase domain-containing protein [Chloroflexi bacterium]|nr:lytic transglycosylase domain-containing protein [Chloroflexota bacterium]
MTERPPSGASPQGFLNWLLSLVVIGLLVAMFFFWIQAVQGPGFAASSYADASPLPAFFTPEVRYWSADIQRWAAANDLDPLLVATVMQLESCGDPRAVSHAGARGLFQVMPYHFQAGENPLDPDTNARRGLAYLRRMLTRADGDVRLALAAYNGGPARLEQPESGWPAETRRYVAWGWAIYQDAQAGRERSPALEAWLNAGGRALCHQAQANLPALPPALPSE